MFTATFRTPFIEADLNTLSERYPVTNVISSGFTVLLRFIGNIFLSNITFSWFASVYSSLLVLLARLTGKKSIIVIGGVDVAKLPELEYGIWNSGWRSFLVTRGLRHAHVIIAVDESLKDDAKKLARYDGNNIVVVPTGYDGTTWFPHGKKENSVLCVAKCDDVSRIRIKGIDFLLDVARTMPEVHFIVIGIADTLRKQLSIPENVTVHPFVANAALLGFYQRTKVYFQPSLREGLPNTLCEAMLCECYPVGTNVGGIPTAIGSTGTILPYGDIDLASSAIRTGLASHACPEARERIIKHFSKEQRQEKLYSIIETLYRE